MKAIKQSMVWSLLILVLASGCKKYAEGPGLSLRSKEARVVNEWKVDYAFDYRDTMNVTIDYTGETFAFVKGGDFMEKKNGLTNNTGKWEFTADKDSLRVTISTEVDNYLILKLKENEMWLKDKDEEIHLIPAK